MIQQMLAIWSSISLCIVATINEIFSWAMCHLGSIYSVYPMLCGDLNVLKSRDITLLTKVCIVTAMLFPVVMYSCESWTRKEGQAPKNWCLWSMVLEKTPESPLDNKEIKAVNLKGNQLWIHIGRTDAKAEAPAFWSSDGNSKLIRKVPDAGKD